MEDLEKFKHRILFNEIHNELYSERDVTFRDVCEKASFLVRHKFVPSGSDGVYILFLKLAGAVIRKEMLIELCKDLKNTIGAEGWKSFHGVWNEGDETYYENHFASQIDTAKKLMTKLRPLLIEYTKDWGHERKQMDLDKPEGRFLKKWYLDPTTKNTV